MVDSDAVMALGSVVAFFSVPIIWIVTTHQRKMAEIIHRGHSASTDGNLLASEMRELRQAVNQQTIAMDSLATEIRKTLPATPPREPLTSRLSQDQHLS